jgi:glycosyltransferase involved in cell wall biosynthesis
MELSIVATTEFLQRHRETQAEKHVVDPQVIVIVIAAFNQAGVIGGVVREVRQSYPNVIVVDDGSSDGTAACALASGAVVLRHPVNLGQGAALQTGITYALVGGDEYIVTFDADGQHACADIAGMVRALIEHDAEVSLASRFLGKAVGISITRRVLFRLAVLFTRLTTGLNATDAHNGLRVFTRAAARKIKITQNRMAHASELLEQIARLKIRYVEVPATIPHTGHSRAKGQTLLGVADIIGDLVLGKLARGS